MTHYTENGGDPDFPSANELETHTFECDAMGCKADYSGDGTFGEVWAEAKSNGWRCYKEVGGWVHYCPQHARR